MTGARTCRPHVDGVRSGNGPTLRLYGFRGRHTAEVRPWLESSRSRTRDLDDDTRARIEAGRATGMYTTPLPLQIVAHSKVALRAMDESYKAQFRCGALDDRLHELVRLRSAQLGACEPCSMSRKDEDRHRGPGGMPRRSRPVRVQPA